MTYTIILCSSIGGELDRKHGDDPAALLRAYADEGCLSGGDTLRILDDADDDQEPAR